MAFKLVLVDDDAKLRESIQEGLKDDPNFTVVQTLINGYDAIHYFNHEKEDVDVLVIDNVMPYMDGISVIEYIKKNNIQPNMKVLLLNSISNEVFIRKAAEIGAYYYLLKPFNFSFLYETLMWICNEGVNNEVEESYTPKLNENNFLVLDSVINSNSTIRHAAVIKTNLSQLITEIISQLGIPAHVKGYMFLREAIECVYNNFAFLGNLTKVLYPTIADKFKTTDKKVERAIRHAISLIWDRGNKEYFEEIFGYPMSHIKPTNSEFIATIADRLKVQSPDIEIKEKAKVYSA